MTTATTTVETVPFFHGKITFRNIDTDEHRTFQLRRQATDAEFAPGKTILSILTGSDNESDYTGFAFVSEEYGLCIWRKRRESAHFRYYADMIVGFLGLDEPEEIEIGSRKYSVHAERRCAVCGRTLTTPESVERGIGPICAGKGGF